MLEKCVLTTLELNWNQRLGHKKTKLNIGHRMLTSSTQLQNRSFHVVERTRTSSKCQKMKYARAKRAKILFFIVRYANLWGFWLLSSSWLLKLRNTNQHSPNISNIYWTKNTKVFLWTKRQILLKVKMYKIWAIECLISNFISSRVLKRDV